MAEEINSKISDSKILIFKNITFFMRPCRERQDLRPTIEHEGGKITSKVTATCYKLAEKGSFVSREGYVSTDFVQDCIKQGQLLDTESYKVTPGIVVGADAERSFLSCDSNDSLEHASVIIKTSTKECKGRTKFTKEEDLEMITYLIEERRYHEATGKRVWKDMEMLQITNHSSESMSARYRKVILPNLDKYKYDIDQSWMSKLKGYVQIEKDPEFSFDALFHVPRKKPLEMTTGKRKERNKSARDNVENAARGVKQGTGLKRKPGSEVSDVDDAIDDRSNKDTSLFPGKGIVELDDGRLSQTANMNTYDFNSDLDRPLSLNESSTRKRNREDTILDSPKDSNKRRTLLQNSDSPVHKAASPSKAGNVVQKCSENSSEVEKNTNEISDNSQESRADNSVSCDLLSGDSFDDMLSNYLSSQNKKETDTSSQKGVQSSDKRTHIKRIGNKEQENDGKTNLDVTDSSKPDTTRDLDVTDSSKPDTTRDPEVNSGKRTTRSTTRALRNLPLSEEEESASKGTDKNVSPAQSKKKAQGLESSQNEVDSAEEKKIIATCKAIAEDFSIEPSYVKEILYGFSGDVNVAVEWIKFGPDFTGTQPWTASCDEELSKGEVKALVTKYGKESVQARLYFLEGM